MVSQRQITRNGVIADVAMKYEDVYIRYHATVPDLDEGLERYFTFYNHERTHQSLDYEVPATVHLEAVESALC